MFSKTFFIFVLFIAIASCSISDYKKKEEEALALIARITENGLNSLEHARSELASFLLTRYNDVQAELNVLNDVLKKYDKKAKDAKQSITQCYIDEVNARKILSIGNTQFLDCIYYKPFTGGDLIIANSTNLIASIKNIINECITTENDDIFESCASRKFQNVGDQIESYRYQIEAVVSVGSAGGSACATSNKHIRTHIIQRTKEQFISCVENILKK